MRYRRPSMYRTTKSLRCSISCETMAWAASTSSSSRAGLPAVPIYRHDERVSKLKKIHRFLIVTFRINPLLSDEFPISLLGRRNARRRLRPHAAAISHFAPKKNRARLEISELVELTVGA